MCRQVSPCLDKLPRPWDRSRETCSNGLGGEANHRPPAGGQLNRSPARKTPGGAERALLAVLPRPRPQQSVTFAAFVVEQVRVDRRVEGGIVELKREVVAALLGTLRPGGPNLSLMRSTT